MPIRPKKQCNRPGCSNTSLAAYCDKHLRDITRISDSNRKSACKRGYNRAWQKARLSWLTNHPLCVKCKSMGIVTAASVVDHRIPHRGDNSLFWDSNNWDSMCKSCHDIKTANGK